MNTVDFALQQDGNGIFSLAITNRSPVIDNSLRSLVVASLFTDRRISQSDPLPTFFDAGQDYRGGCWGDDFPTDGGAPGVQARPRGSLLWVLRNAKQIDETVDLAVIYVEQALQWLIDSARATAISATASWVYDGVLSVYIQITQPDGEVWSNQLQVGL